MANVFYICDILILFFESFFWKNWFSIWKGGKNVRSSNISQNTMENIINSPDSFYFCSHFYAFYRVGPIFYRKKGTVPKKKKACQKWWMKMKIKISIYWILVKIHVKIQYFAITMLSWILNWIFLHFFEKSFYHWYKISEKCLKMGAKIKSVW